MMLRADRAEERKTEAQARVEERAQRSPEQQLALLDHRLGKGIGAKKERARLLAPRKPRVYGARDPKELDTK